MTKTKSSRFVSTLLGAAGAMALSFGGAAAQTIVIENADLHLVGDADNPTRIDGGMILIRDGRIAAVGETVTVPDAATRIDAGGQPVTPGLFAALSGVGLEEIGATGEGNDRSLQGSTDASAALMAADGIYPDSTVIPISRAGGVTRAFSTISPGDGLFGGCGALIMLDGSDDPIFGQCAAHMAVMGYAGATREANSRPAAMAAFRRALSDAQAYRDDPFAFARDREPGQLSSANAKALVPVIEGEAPLMVQVHGKADIARVLDVAAAFDIDLVLVGAAEAHRLADDLAARNIPVIMNPLGNLPGRFETFDSTLAAAGILEKAGVTVAFYDDDIGYTHNARLLPQLAGNAVANGMSHQGALEAITLAPAQIFGVEDRLGTLAPGKVADVVVWDGDPLELTSRPAHVIIGGTAQSLDNRQSALARRYKDLSDNGLPFAYRGEK